ncbi:MAG: hypothetical protein AUI14_07920 [Actinobacteria bacterium 13_2_20CM_2_71_6]|nr:MAG: hypothetical protein AUI14_07920 [Actinobacteria bacterium 13_2_20CM_2_71_6]
MNVETPGAEAPVADVPPVRVPAGRDRRRYALAVGAGLAAAWLVPVLTHVLSVDWVVPLLMWLAVASLLRAGRTVLDRLMFALMLLLGVVPVAGLLITVWPWGLQPVPVAGFGFSALVLIAALLRRPPRLPRAFRPADLVTLGLSALSLVAVFWPYRHADKTGRFALIAAGGDYASHFSLYDAIRGVGGYVFLNRTQTAGQVWDAYQTYPQGLHFTASLLASFMRSDGTQAASAVTELNTFVWFEPATFVIMCLAILWAMRWLAGPGLRAWLALPAGTFGAMYLLFGDPLQLLWSGYWPEIAGLAEFAILIAVLARPLHRVREQVVLVTALIVAICWTYFLMLPIIGVAILVWLVQYRRRLRGHRRLVAVAAVVGAVAGSIMIYVNFVGWPAADHLATVGGSILHPDMRTLLCITGVVFAAATAAAWRQPAWRAYTVMVLTTGAFVVFVAVYLKIKIHALDYFYYKATHVAMIVAVVGMGSLAPLLRTVIRRSAPGRPTPRRILAWSRTAIPALALSVAAVAALGPFLSPTFARTYEDGHLAWPWPAQAALRTVAVIPPRTGELTLVWAGRGIPAHATHWTEVLLRDHGHGWRAQMWTGSHLSLEWLFDHSPYRVRVVTDNPKIISEVQDLLARRPDLREKVEIVVIPLPA